MNNIYKTSCSQKSLKNIETVYLSFEKKSTKQQRTKKQSLPLTFLLIYNIKVMTLLIGKYCFMQNLREAINPLSIL